MSRKGAGVTIEGGPELEAALGELTKATARNAIKRGLLRGGKLIARKAKHLAPRRTGDLIGSINVSTKRPKRDDPGKQAYADVMKNGGTREQARAALIAANRANPKQFAEVYVGPDKRPQAIMQEFGTVDHPPQPFMRPAWDKTQKKALDLVLEGVRDELRKAVERARRKARRQGLRAIGSNTSAGQRRARKAAAKGFKVR